ncbi:MAG: hypothetical protein J0L61_12475 [Planctomycetes bacterium]|nr:hypothetical protein [Planctomycetota bacterium]
MVVGVPGTGIGGLFYLLMACSMPFVEAWKWVRGERSQRRWGFIIAQLGLVGSIVAAMTVQAILAKRVFTWWAANTSDHELAQSLELLVKQHSGATAGFATFASLAMLTLVIIAVHFLRVTAGRRARIVAVR